MRDTIDDLSDRTDTVPDPGDEWAVPACDDEGATPSDAAVWDAWIDTGGEG
jgi:hypothetical protein